MGSRDWDNSDPWAETYFGDDRRTIHKDVRRGNVVATRQVLGNLAGCLSHSAGMLHGYRSMWTEARHLTTRSDSPCLWYDVAFVEEAVAELYVVCSAIAQRRLGVGISVMMEANRSKLQARLAQGAPISSQP